MKVAKVSLLQEPDKSFIYYKENNPLTPWHHHPEYFNHLEFAMLPGCYHDIDGMKNMLLQLMDF